jgi:hypothetical protein
MHRRTRTRVLHLGTVCLPLAVGLALGAPTAAFAGGAPSAVTGMVSANAAPTATVSATVIPNGLPTTYRFQYQSAGGNQFVNTPTVSAGSGTSAVTVHTTMPGLASGTAYQYRVLAANSAGIRTGAKVTFTSAAPTPTPTPTPTPVPIAHAQTAWAPVGAMPSSDAQAAALVTHEPENRPANVAANKYVPTNAELAAFYAANQPSLNDPVRKYVTGRPGLTNPSTDDLIQWAAHKWGIPEDWIRAEAVQETHWNQAPLAFGQGLGDKATVSATQFAHYPAAAQVSSSALTVYQSMGIMQCKWIDTRTDVNAGTNPLRWESTAFNLDYYAHYVRWLYSGYTAKISWIQNIYKGNQWNSIGGWFGGGGNAASQAYIANVQSYLTSEPWTQPGF